MTFRVWLHKTLFRCHPPENGVEGDQWVCPTCGMTWEFFYHPDLIGVTEGVMDAGGYDGWGVVHHA